MRNLIIIILIACPFLAFSQSIERQVIGSSGNYFEGSGYQHCFTTGEIAIETTTNSTITLCQGFQQANNPTVSVNDPTLQFSFNAYPNPTQDEITLDFTAEQTMDISIVVVDMMGKYVYDNGGYVKVSGNLQTQLDFSKYASGNYIIRITDRSGKVDHNIQVQKMK